MDDRELCDSIRAFGCILPRLVCGGLVYDGRRRERFANATGRTIHTLELSPHELPKALWLLHPERAIEHVGKLTLEEYATAFGARVLDVARYLNTQRRAVPVLSGDLGKNTQLHQSWWPPRLHYAASIAARERGVNLSAFVRESVATHVARLLNVDSYELARPPLAGPGSGKQHARTSRSTGSQHRAPKER